MLRLGLLVAVFIWLACEPASADVAKVRTPECDIRVTGEIEAGDADLMIKALQEVGTTNPAPNRAYTRWETEQGNFTPRLCLNSPGGSFAEAIQFLRSVIRGGSLVTVIEEGAECYSACAIIFLAGHIEQPGDNEFVIIRRLHVGGQLGFHAPYQEVTDRTSKSEIIAKSYRAGVDAVADLLTFEEKFFPRALLSEFLKVGPNDFFRITKVWQAAVWDIGLFGYRVPNLRTEAALERVCGNVGSSAFASQHSFVVRDLKREVMGSVQQEEELSFDLGRSSKKMEFSAGIDQELTCVVWARAVGKDTYIHAEVGVPGRLSGADPFESLTPAKLAETDPDAFTPRWTAYPVLTLLKDIVGGSPFVSPASAQPRPTLWEHNRSIVRAVEGTAKYQILYEEPREGMLKAGATKGSGLFQGIRVGSKLVGSGYVFNAKCGPSEFQAKGEFSADGKRLVLRGKAPSLSDNCAVLRLVDQEWHFKFVSELQ